MDDVLLLIVRKVMPDCLWGGLLGVSSADECSESLDGVLFFQEHRDARTRAHELEEVFIEGLPSVDGIEFTCALKRQVYHFHCHNSEACLFNSAENFSDDSFSNAVGFENRECLIRQSFPPSMFR